MTEISPTLRLIALNEALDETLIREDYEQAALLRDQIRALKEKSGPKGEKDEKGKSELHPIFRLKNPWKNMFTMCGLHQVLPLPQFTKV